MKVGRRAVLRGAAGLVSALVAAPAFVRLRTCGAGSGGAAPASPDGVRATLCTGRVRAPSVAAPDAVRAPLHAESLARWVDPLPIPRVLSSSEQRPDPADPSRTVPLYRVRMREARVQVHRDLPHTSMWTYDGEMPGPTLETRAGHGLLVEWSNELPARHFLPVDHGLHGAGTDVPEVRAVVHVHGARVPPAGDGYPEDWRVPGQATLVHYPADQESATLWYHDHAMGLERLNQYAGLLGCFFVRDDAEDALGLPDRAHEIPLVLCDRRFDADGQLRYPTSGNAAMPWVSEVYGDTTLVNGKLFPYVDVEPARYRLRVVNASNSRTFTLSLSLSLSPAAEGDAPAAPLLRQIGSDQGLLPAPVTLGSLMLAPGERADLVVDLSAHAGRRLVLINRASELLQLRVASGPGAVSAPPAPPSLPATLRPVPRLAAAAAKRTRTLTLDEYHDPTTGRMLMLLGGKYWHDPVTEKPELGTIEIWSLLNLSEDAHPIHLHLVRFQVLERQLFDADEYKTSGRLVWTGEPLPPPPGEAGWKDTVVASPGMATRIIMRFEGYTGRYVWHCHVLEHAANEMMRPFEVVAPA